MLSLTQLLYHIFQPESTIAEEAVKALTDAIHHVKMDQVFKEKYTFFAFLRLDILEPKYHLQVYNLHELWPKLNDVIDRETFFRFFSQECQELNLSAEEYDLDSAFLKAQNEWAVELMVATADFILKWNENKVISTPVASWQHGHICVDQNVCTQYRDRLFDDYNRDMN